MRPQIILSRILLAQSIIHYDVKACQTLKCKEKRKSFTWQQFAVCIRKSFSSLQRASKFDIL